MTTKCFSTPHKKKKNTPAYQTHPKHEAEIEKKRKKNIGEKKRWVFLKYLNTCMCSPHCFVATACVHFKFVDLHVYLGRSTKGQYLIFSIFYYK